MIIFVVLASLRDPQVRAAAPRGDGAPILILHINILLGWSFFGFGFMSLWAFGFFLTVPGGFLGREGCEGRRGSGREGCKGRRGSGREGRRGCEGCEGRIGCSGREGCEGRIHP